MQVLKTGIVELMMLYNTRPGKIKRHPCYSRGAYMIIKRYNMVIVLPGNYNLKDR